MAGADEVAEELQRGVSGLPVELVGTAYQLLAEAQQILAPVAASSSQPEIHQAAAAMAHAMVDLRRAQAAFDIIRSAIQGLIAAIMGPSGTVPATAACQPVMPAPAPVGRWAASPSRTFGDPFNERYEVYVRTSTGGPRDREYLVERDGQRTWFDTTRRDVRDGKTVEVLIDAKGRYTQFIDGKTGEFASWWRKQSTTGLRGALAQAQRQVRMADGRPVEWHCAEEVTADLFNDEFALDPALDGHIEAVYRPIPDTEG